MRALYNFTKNVLLSIGLFVVLYFCLMVWCAAALFHGMNYLGGTKR